MPADDDRMGAGGKREHLAGVAADPAAPWRRGRGKRVRAMANPEHTLLPPVQALRAGRESSKPRTMAHANRRMAPPCTQATKPETSDHVVR